MMNSRSSLVETLPRQAISSMTAESASFAVQQGLREPGWAYLAAKRCLDLALALPLLLVFVIAFLIVGVALILEDGFPILYSCEAVGLRGKSFRLYKFRSMRKDAETYFSRHPEQMAEFQREQKLREDPRVLRVGRIIRRTSIDEIPQVLNVLRGEMSFVGPRYVRQDELERYGTFGNLRLHMLPGITGLWQVSGRNTIPYEQRVVFDRTYYYTRSIRTDLAILFRTIPTVLSRRGAF